MINLAVESIVIFSICFSIIVIFWRSGNVEYAFAATPVLVIPVSQITGYFLWKILETISVEVPNHIVYMGSNLLGLAIASFMIALFSTKFKQKKNRNLYIVSLGLYCLVLTGIFLNYHIQKYIL